MGARPWSTLGAICVAVLAGAAPVSATRMDAPTLTPPADMTVTATTPCGSTDCAFVTYSFGITGGTAPYTLICNLPSGSFFTVGTHTITCTVSDARGSSSPPASFTLTVDPGGPPPPPPPPPPPSLAITPPADMTLTAASPCGSTYCAVLVYTYTVTGGYPPYTLICNHPSGSVLPVGTFTVSCIGQDSEDDSTPPATFDVTIAAAAPSGGDAGSSSAPAASGSSTESATGGAASGGATTTSPASGGTTASSSGTPAGSTSGDSGSATSSSPAPAADPATTTVATVATPVAQAAAAAPSIAASRAGRQSLSFAVRLPTAGTVTGTLATRAGKTLLRFRVKERAGRTEVRRMLRAHVARGTRLTLRLVLRSGRTRLARTLRFRA